ncbi:hypothetical protein FRB90_009774 [Tulasnella sp. 427]|nr:hypothetical protein FRB90_009774 [Tulasnella sp. 427]
MSISFSIQTALMTNPHPEQPRSSDDLAGSLDHDHNKPRDSDDTLIASPAEDIAAEGAAASVFQNTPVKKQNNCNGLVSVGPRPLMLGTFKIATLSPCTPPKSRPASSLPPAPRTPTSPSARWSSYTPPLTPLSPTPSSPFSDEVETLKAQLAASEAMVKILMKEKFEAVSASRRLTVDLKNLQEQQSQWSEEKERMMAKLQELDEPEEVVTVAPLSPPPEGMWFGGSNKTRKPPKEIQSPLAKESPYPSSPDVHTPLPAVHWKVPELKISPPRSSDTHSDSELHDNQDTNPEISPRTSAGEETLARIGSIFLDRGPLDDGCDPTSTPSPASTPTASYFPPINHPSPGSSPVSPYRPRRWSHHRATAVDGSQFIPPTIRSATPPSHDRILPYHETSFLTQIYSPRLLVLLDMIPAMDILDVKFCTPMLGLS